MSSFLDWVQLKEGFKVGDKVVVNTGDRDCEAEVVKPISRADQAQVSKANKGEPVVRVKFADTGNTQYVSVKTVKLAEHFKIDRLSLS